MAIQTSIDVKFGLVVSAAQAALGGVVTWQVTGTCGERLGSGIAATLAAAVTATSAVVNAQTFAAG
jgi:hypothetical protein